MPISNSIQIMGIFTVAAIRLVPMLTQLTASLNNMRFAKDGIDKIYNDLKNNETYVLSKLNRELINDFENISIKNISYKYDKESMNVLSNVSLEIEEINLLV